MAYSSVTSMEIIFTLCSMTFPTSIRRSSLLAIIQISSMLEKAVSICKANSCPMPELAPVIMMIFFIAILPFFL